MKKTRARQPMCLGTFLALSAGIVLAAVCAALLAWFVNKFLAASILFVTG
jgi:hypothetical protein